MKFPAFEPIDLKNTFDLHDLRVDHVFPDPNQPRKHFNDVALQALSDSIKAYGVVQPIVVRELSSERYVIVAGERRWRATRLAGLTTIPGIIKSDKKKQDGFISLVENVQREALNPIELAESFEKLSQQHQLSHEDIAKIVGKSRASVTNTLRLLNLSDAVKRYVIEEKIEAGHARSLLSLPDHQQLFFAQKIVDEQLTVRDAERLIRTISHAVERESAVTYFPELPQMALELTELFNLKSQIKINKSGVGSVSIHFGSLVQLKEMIEKMQELVERV